jgi:threonine aldolase
MLYPLDGPRGMFTAAQVEEAIRPESPHYPRSRIVEIENTHNMGGGSIGAVLAGSHVFIKDAHRLKHLFGGAMRQAGIIAAAGVYALEHHVARLAEDHAHATILAQSLAALPAVSLNPMDVETNIIIFDVGASGREAKEIGERLEKAGVRVSVLGRTKLRAVTHLDVSRPDVERAIEVFRHVL